MRNSFCFSLSPLKLCDRCGTRGLVTKFFLESEKEVSPSYLKKTEIFRVQ